MGRMPAVPESSAGPADRAAVTNDYDSFAEAYSAETEANLINGYYARPRSSTWPGTWPAVGFSTSAADLALCSQRCATGAPP
jgi:hypothetical protein